MAEPWARFEGFEGFEGFKGFEGFEGFEGLHSPSESLEKTVFSFLVQILLPRNLPTKKKLFFHFLCKVWLRTPDPATAFPNRNKCNGRTIGKVRGV